MTCQYLIGICSKTRLPCPHCSVDGHCDEAACMNAAVPTWGEIVDIYIAAMHPRKNRETSIRTSVAAFVRALGTTLDAKIAVTDDQIDAAYANLRTEFSPYTVDSIFSALKVCASQSRREIKMEYRRRAKKAPDLDLPVVHKTAPKIVELTEAQRLAVREEMFRLRTSKRRPNRVRFLWLWFAYNFGMRPVDIGNIKWDCIAVHSNGSWWLDYIPTKTAKTGKHAGCKLTDVQIEEVRPFIGAKDEYVIQRHEERIPKSGCVKNAHGEYKGMHKSIRNYFIRFMKSIGVIDSKPQYALRKDCSQRTIRDHGILHEAQMLGHTPQIAMRNYTDISKIDLKEGL